MPTRVAWGAVITYIVLACGLGWLVALPLWIGDGLASPLTGIILPVMMFTPALAVLLVMWIFKLPGENRARWLGMWPLRPVKRVVWFMVLATVAPAVVVLVGVFVAGALGFVQLDSTFSGMAAQIEATTPPEYQSMVPPVGFLVFTQLLMIPLGALINSVLAFGEEIGWRGWMLSALKPAGAWPALVLTGLVWGVWHAPIILLGYNFERPNLTGVLLMIGGCIAWGILLGWSRLRSGSVWPAVIGHGSLNAAGGTIFLFVAAGDAPDLAIVGPLGFVTWGVIAVVVVILALAGQFRPSNLEKELEPRKDAEHQTVGE